MSTDINQALLNLESSLNEIDSARKEVETVTRASQRLQNVVCKYLKLVKDVDAEIANLLSTVDKGMKLLSDNKSVAIDNLKKSSDGILNSFKDNSERAINVFQNEVTIAVESVQSNLQSMQKQIQSLAELEKAFKTATITVTNIGENIKQLGNDIDLSQKQQDVALASISDNINQYNTNVNTNISTVTNLLTQIINIGNMVQNVVTAIKSDQETILRKCDSLNTTVNSTKDQVLESYKSNNEELNQRLDYMRNINIGIGIALFILILILHVVY